MLPGIRSFSVNVFDDIYVFIYILFGMGKCKVSEVVLEMCLHMTSIRSAV